MSDLERGRELMRNFPPTLAEITDALAAARREGAEQASGEIHALRKALHDETMKRLASAEEMRERAARLADGYCTDRTDDVARGIRALPLTPEGPL